MRFPRQRAAGGVLPPQNRSDHDLVPIHLSQGSYEVPEAAQRHFTPEVLERLNVMSKRNPYYIPEPMHVRVREALAFALVLLGGPQAGHVVLRIAEVLRQVRTMREYASVTGEPCARCVTREAYALYRRRMYRLAYALWCAFLLGVVFGRMVYG